MTKAPAGPASLPHRRGVAGRAPARACKGSRAPSSHLVLLALALSACVALLAPSIASATFTREPLHQITGTESGAFTQLGGVAVDGENHVWVGDSVSKTENQLDEFSSAKTGNEFVKTYLAGINQPEHLAFAHEPEPRFYVSGNGEPSRPNYEAKVEVFAAGALVETWPQRFGGDREGVRTAVDNSTDTIRDSDGACGTFPLASTECFVYITHSGESELESPAKPQGIEKFSTKGESEPFSDAGKCAVEPSCKYEYVSGNEITGTPAGPFTLGHDSPTAIAVDGEGNIYAVGYSPPSFVDEIDEYKATGEFVRSFAGSETPGLDGSTEGGGWGGEVEGLAIDPLNGHLLAAVSQQEKGRGEFVHGAVDELDPASGKYLSQITQGAAGEPLGSAIEMAVDAEGNLYVADPHNKAVDVYAEGSFRPSTKLADVSARTAESATLNGFVNPEGLPLGECYFEYVSETAFGESGFASLETKKAGCEPTAGSIAVDSSFHPVAAAITGLTSGTTYRYRLLAASAAGGEFASEALAFTAPHVPRIDATTASNISSTSADLGARIDPLGAATSYRFEYDTRPYTTSEAPHGQSVPVPAGSIGAGGPTGASSEPVLAQIAGLAPGSTYYYRVVAENSQGAVVGGVCEAGGQLSANCTFMTLPSATLGLPDARAYEMLTPPEKRGGSDMFTAEKQTNGEYLNESVGTPSESGNQFLFETKSAFGPFPGSGASTYVFSRTPGGWTYTSLASPSLGVQSVSGTIFNPLDMSRVGLTDEVGSLQSEGGTHKTNLVGTPGGPYTTLNVDPAVHEGGIPGTEIAGASHDLSHLVLAGPHADFCPGAASLQHGEALCEWAGGYERVGGELEPELKLVNANSGGSLLNTCGAVLGATGNERAVSADGSRILFTAPDPYSVGQGGECWDGETGHAPQLYLRASGQTVDISAPEPGVQETYEEGGEQKLRSPVEYFAHYVGASEDDSKIFFVTGTELTKEAAEIGLHDPELYEYDVESAKLTRISAADAGTPEPAGGASVYRVPAVSANGEAVYFTAFGALAPGATQDPTVVEEGPVNLYRYDVATRTTTYVAGINAVDYVRNTCFPSPANREKSLALCGKADWYTTPAGRYLLFASTNELTGYSTVTAPGAQCLPTGAPSSPNGHCDELYRYDATANKLTCVSCDPSGALPVSDALFSRSAGLGPFGEPRPMSDEGSRVFFDTADPLVPEDDNGTLDVYEWEAQGTGGCELAQGCVHLISTGRDAAPSYFLGSSPDGADVFIGTHSRLVPQDTDNNGDIYDARICTTAEPCVQAATGETAQCEGGACQTPPAAPLDATPSSLTFSGPGNLASPSIKPVVKVAKKTVKCKRGYVKKKVKKKEICVKKPKPKKRATKASHDRRTGR